MWQLDPRKAECWRNIKLWCWRRLSRVPWTAQRSNQSILKDINPEYSLERLILKLKLQYFGHLMQRVNSLEKTLMLGKWKSPSYRSLHDPMDCSPPGSVHGILQTRILEWVAFPFSRGSSQPRSPTLQADFLPSDPPGKPVAGKCWGQKEKGAIEDEVVGWHHWFHGHEFEQTLGDSGGQRSLGCYSSWGCEELGMT